MAPKITKRKVLTEREQIAERLKNARNDLRLTQMELAEKAGLGRSTIMHYENAKAAPGAMELLSLAKVLEMSPNYILSGKERFIKEKDEEELLDSQDHMCNSVRVAMCLATLEPEVQDNFSNLLLSMVKGRIGDKEFKKFMVAINAATIAFEGMSTNVDTLAASVFDDKKIEEIEAEMKAAK